MKTIKEYIQQPVNEDTKHGEVKIWKDRELNSKQGIVICAVNKVRKNEKIYLTVGDLKKAFNDNNVPDDAKISISITPNNGSSLASTYISVSATTKTLEIEGY